jgi:Outer membrane protein beta-barrel domain
MKSGMNIITSKQFLVLSIVLMLFTTSGAYAQLFQSVHYGVRAGLDGDKISGRSFTGKLNGGVTLGGYAELNFNNSWGIQPELNYHLLTSETTDAFNSIYQGVTGTNVQLNYVELPVLLFFKPTPELSIMLGPQYSYLFAQTQNLLPSGGQLANQEPFEKNNISVVFGAQLNLGKFKVGARYNWGVVSLDNLNNSDNWKTQGAQLYLAYGLK